MTHKDFEDFRDFILSQNKYFTSGYANAFNDSETGLVIVRDGGDLIPIFPEDSAGNYFYIRVEPSMIFSPIAGLSDCGGITTYNDRINAYIVAIVDDADDYKLINALRDTCSKYKSMYVQATGANWLRESVVNLEITASERKDDIISSFLQRLENQSIVRLAVTITKEYIPNFCITDPCKTC